MINKRIITSLFDFCNRECLLSAARSELKGGRCRPIIPTSTIFLNLLMLVTFKQRPFLKLEIMRMPEVRSFFKTDSTIARVLPSFDKEPLRKYLKTVYLKARKEGLCKVEGERMKVAAVLFLDVQPAENVAKELVASRELIESLKDMEMAFKKTINQILSHGSYPVIRDAEGLFSKYEMFQDEAMPV